MARYLVSMILEVNDDSHPRKFVPEAITQALTKGEDILDYNFMEYTGDEILVCKDSGTILSPERCLLVNSKRMKEDQEYSDSEIIEIAEDHGTPVIPGQEV